MIISRTLATSAKQAVKKMPILTVTGPRQSGKTTFIKDVFRDYVYVNLEEPETRYFASSDCKGFLEKYSSKVIFDEAQNVPELFSYIQVISDQHKEKGQFILTGSNNFLLNEKLSQTLAGRTRVLTLLPFSMYELSGTSFQFFQFEKYITTGFYPRIYQDELKSSEWIADYIQTYLERDLRTQKSIGDISRFRQFLKLCAANIGQMVNFSRFGNELGISYHTAQSWISLLESSYILFMLPPYHQNFNKRIIKSPKLYFYDTGLASYLLGIKQAKDFDFHFAKGALFENLIIAEIRKRFTGRGELPELYYWRDSSGNEIDCMVADGDVLNIIEIKSGKTIHKEFFKGLEYFSKLNTGVSLSSFLIYGGGDVYKRGDITILGWSRLDEVLKF